MLRIQPARARELYCAADDIFLSSRRGIHARSFVFPMDWLYS